LEVGVKQDHPTFQASRILQVFGLSIGCGTGQTEICRAGCGVKDAGEGQRKIKIKIYEM
jgi:hypothetical protein